MNLPNITEQDLQAIKQLSNSDRDYLKTEINRADPHTIFTPAGDSNNPNKRKIICPVCGNGTGSDKTPVEAEFNGDRWLYNCFKCDDFSGDLIKIIANEEHLNLKSFDDMCKALAIGAILIGFPLDKSAINNSHDNFKEHALILDDIAQARKRLKEIPQWQMRGLSFETYHHFGCGYLHDWTHPKNRIDGTNTKPSRRYIIPTPNHYNAAALPDDRSRLAKKYHKMHAGSMELFNSRVITLSDTLLILEGEFDVMSIYQATKGKLGAVAVLGAANWKTTLTPFFPVFAKDKKKIIILFDADDAGRKNAEKLRGELLKNKIPAVTRFLFDYLYSDHKQSLSDKVDANDILQKLGEHYLNDILDKITIDTRADFESLNKQFADRADLSAPMHDDDRDQNFSWTQDKVKSCPVNLRIPQNFIFNQNGITKVLPAKKDSDPPKYVRVAHVPIIPTKKFREPIKDTLEYGLAILSDDKWRNIEVDAALIGDTRELSKILNRHGGLVDEPKIISQFINATIALNPELQRIKSYKQTGWTSDDYEDFAYPSADGKAVVRRVGYDYERIFKPRGDKDAWKQKFLEVEKQGGAIAHAIIGGACSAPLIKPLEDIPNLQIHLWGNKSIGKTPMLKFAVSMFGNTDVGALSHTFSATPKSRLETACAFSDLPLICEELESIGAKDTEKLSTDIYNYFLGIGGQALKKDGTPRDPKLFNGVRLTSGEHSLVPRNGNGGEFKRVLELRCSSLLDEDFASDLYGFVKRNHGLFGEQWIHYVANNWQLISKQYHRTLSYVKSCQKKGRENDLTQLRTLTISLVSYQHVKVCIGLQSINDIDKINAEILADLNAIIPTLPTSYDMDDTTRAIEFLQSFFVANLKHFSHEVDNPSFNNEFTQGAIECYGKDFKNGEVAFIPTILKRALTQEGGFKSADKIIDECFDKGYLHHNAGRKTYFVRINSKPIRTIFFKSGIISIDSDSELEQNEA